MERFTVLLLACLLGSIGMQAQKGGNISIDDLKGKAQLQQNMVQSDRMLQARYKHMSATFLSELLNVPIIREEHAAFTAVSLSWSAPNWDREKSKIWLRLYNNMGDEELLQLKVDEHRESDEERFATQLQFFQKVYRYCQLRVVFEAGSESSMEDIEIRFYDPGETPTKAAVTSATARGACDCPQPGFLERNDWCPNGRCPISGTPQETAVTHLIIHHSAGTNSSNDWPAVVRAIWDFHVNTREWDDIGYNWLIDSDGQIYQGRGDDVRGAHFCGANSNTMGVCLLGTFTTEMPSQQSRDALANLLSWKACDRDIDPMQTRLHPGTGKTIYTITGHRDGCATECPGTTFFPAIANLRTQIDEQLQACQTTSIEPKDISQLNIRIFPNPTSGSYLSVDASALLYGGAQSISIELMESANGQRLKKWTINGQNTITPLDISGVSPGLYLLQIQFGEKTYIRKIVKY